MRNFTVPSTNSGFVGSAARKLLSTTALTAAGIMALYSPAMAADDWSDHQIVDGSTSVNVDQSAQATNITQHTHTVKARGDGDIKSDWTVNIDQNNASSKYVLFDIEGDATQIRGNLNANGEVYIFNQNGVIFGEGSVTDVGSIVAAAGTADYEDVVAGSFDVAVEGDVAVENGAMVKIAENGLGAFVGRNVTIDGKISAKMATVAVGAGTHVTIDTHGDGLFEMAVAGEDAAPLIEIAGEIEAEGGRVLLTAAAAKDAVDNIINVDGIVDVSSATVKGGKIILSGGDSGSVKVAGSLKANGKQGGGDIDVTGQKIELAATTQIEADSAEGDGGQVDIIAKEELYVDGVLKAMGNRAGFIETSAPVVTFGQDTLFQTDHWLLDPTDITIDSTLEGVIETALLSGDHTQMTPAAGTQAGKIFVQETIDWSTAFTLSLIAHDDIQFDAGGGINATGDGNFIADAGDDIHMFSGNTGITTNGGDITLTSLDEFTLSDNAVNANGGNIKIDNAQSFEALADSIKTSGTGTIEINQGKNTGTFVTVANPLIQNVIDAIDNAGSGTNTINVGEGVWSEDVVINKDNIILKGTNNGTAGDDVRVGESVIDATTVGVTIDPGADNAVIDGFTIQNGEVGVFVNGGHNATIENNIIIDQFAASGVSGTGFAGEGDGVYAQFANNTTIQNNAISGQNDEGIQANFVQDLKIFGNVIDNDAIGDNAIEIRDSSGDTVIAGNDITADVRNGILLFNTEGALVGGDKESDGNTITGGTAGVYVDGSHSVTIQNNDILDQFDVTGIDPDGTGFVGKGDGVYLQYSNNAEILNNNFSGQNDEAIQGNFVRNILIQENVIDNTGGDNAIELRDSNGDNRILNNEISNTERNGILAVNMVDTITIADNQIHNVGADGINVSGFENADISYNEISLTHDDGIHLIDGDSADIYGNVIEGAGFRTSGHILADDDLGDGIKTDNVGTPAMVVPTTENTEYGLGSVGAIADLKIYDNAISITNSDGIDAEDSNNVYVNNNLIGHTERNGILVDGFSVTEVSDNSITSTILDGIKIVGNDVKPTIFEAEEVGPSVQDSLYAGVFNNKILLTGGDGIDVSEVGDDQVIPVFMDLGGNNSYGWNVNIDNNEIVMTGENGINATNNGSVIASNNDIFMAGMGYGLTHAIGNINFFASLSMGGGFPTTPVFANEALVSAQNGAPSFDWTWGFGDGINITNAGELGPDGWAVEVDNNRIRYTSGHGVDVDGAPTAYIHDNRVRYAGVKVTEHYGFEDMRDLLSSGPFAAEQHFGGGDQPYSLLQSESPVWSDEEPSRRNLWAGESLIRTVADHIEPSDVVYYQVADGIRADDIYGLEGRITITNEVDVEETFDPYLYALVLDTNNIRFTGDDGIDVSDSGRTLIYNNTIRDAGYDVDYYYGADFNGADGISANNISARVYGEPYYGAGLEPYNGGGDVPQEPSFNYEPDENYALIIRENTVRRTGDDGIEVVGTLEEQDFDVNTAQSGRVTDPYYGGYLGGTTDRVLIAENIISDSGETGEGDFYFGGGADLQVQGDGYFGGYYGNVGPDGFGHDGIHVRNVIGTIYDDPQQKQGPGGSYGTDGGFYGYAVDIIDNEVRRTTDDGIEVFNSDSTLITLNTVRDTGTGSVDDDRPEESILYGGADYYGSDGIHVRNVGGSFGGFLPTNQQQGANGFEPYSVAIVDNDVRRTGDDGIEVVGEALDPYFGGYYGLENLVYSTDYEGTGRTIILGNTVRDAGVSGVYGSLYYNLYDSREGSDYENLYFGYRGSYDGYGGDGIHTRGVGVVFDNNINVDPASVQTAQSGGSYGNGDYAVQIIGNDVRRTGDDGIEVIGVEGENDRIRQTGYYGGYFGSYVLGGVLVEDNDVHRAGLAGGLYASLNINYDGFNFDDGYYSGSLNGYLNLNFGNAGEDGYGADGIHVRGIHLNPSESDNGSVWTAPSLAGEYNGYFGGYAVDVLDNRVRWTADDGIEVRDSDSTFIGFNNVRNAGMLAESLDVYGNYNETRYFGGGYFGVDSIGQELVDGYYGGYFGTEYQNTYASFNGFSRQGGLPFEGSDYTGGDGIHVENVGGIGVNNDGIEVTRAGGIIIDDEFEQYDVVVYDNTINTSADDGIEVSFSGRTRIEDNKVYNSGSASFSGFDGFLSSDDPYFGGYFGVASVQTSSISNFFDGEAVNYYGYINVHQSVGNTGFDYTGNDGIHVNNVFASPAESGPVDPYYGGGDIGTLVNTDINSFEIVNNIVDNSADDGIQVIFSGNGLIDDNQVSNSGTASYFGFDGYFGGPRLASADINDGYLGGGDFGIVGDLLSEIDFDEVHYFGGSGSMDATGGDGINVENGFDPRFIKRRPPSRDDRVRAVSTENILSRPGYFLSTDVDITNNVVSNSADDGIEAIGVTDLFIDTNNVDVSGDDGITIVGYAGFYEEEPYFGGDFETSVTFGGSIEPPTFEAIISNNIVDNSSTDGIQSDNYDLTDANTNVVSNSGENGFFGSGPFHGDVIVSNNTFTDNRIGAQFESGLVDLTGEGNTFEGGEVGLRFAPFDFSVFAEDDDIFTPFSFGPDNTFPYENVPTSGFADLALVDNDGPGSDSLGDPVPYSNYGGTIGAQTFDGQSVFFVELDNEAFFNPGTPTILNGLDSTYIIPGEGPLTPADTGGVISVDQLAFLEERFQHFPDTEDLGLFFFGFVPDIEQEDLFNIFDPANLGASGLDVTVTGPVSIPGQTDVAGITPFAGGNEGEVTPESLNAIETAAGEGESANCWGDTMNVASSGQVVNFSYGTSFEETVGAAATCGSTF